MNTPNHILDLIWASFVMIMILVIVWPDSKKKRRSKYYSISFIYQTEHSEIGFSMATLTSKDYPSSSALFGWIAKNVLQKDNKVVSPDKITILSIQELKEADYNDWIKTD